MLEALMSMYLPNTDLGPIGSEPGEFIDYPTTIEELRHSWSVAALNEDQPALTVDDQQ